jgi:hypothetical protein
VSRLRCGDRPVRGIAQESNEGHDKWVAINPLEPALDRCRRRRQGTIGRNSPLTAKSRDARASGRCWVASALPPASGAIGAACVPTRLCAGAGIMSPRSVADVRPDVLKAAILEVSNALRTQVTDFEQLLEPLRPGSEGSFTLRLSDRTLSPSVSSAGNANGSARVRNLSPCFKAPPRVSSPCSPTSRAVRERSRRR